MASFQDNFHARWHHLSDPHVRDLAWLLDAPDLLDPLAPQWRGQIATLGTGRDAQVQAWLAELDRAPALLHAALELQPMTRLGRYAEKLMAFYFAHQGSLLAHGVQVRSGKNATIGEFDFLLRQGEALVHWEFATKFYLLASDATLPGDMQGADYFIGPNLADSLGAKMRKILDRQLQLGAHPAAQAYLPQPVTVAQALVKGWLFYHPQDQRAGPSSGVSAAHCHGFWNSLSEFGKLDGGPYVILPRLSWLAPARIHSGLALEKNRLQEVLARHFEQDTMPVMIAQLGECDGWMLESSRGFIVPDDWRSKADSRIHHP